MEDLNKRLVEVEYILRELDNEYLKKIPKELWEYIEKEVINNVKEMFNLENLTEQINIKTSRKAYKALGKEPSRYRVSSEALIRRILQGKGLYRINNVVDTNNLISIETGYSVGSYDLENLHGNINFRIGNIAKKYLTKYAGAEDIQSIIV